MRRVGSSLLLVVGLLGCPEEPKPTVALDPKPLRAMEPVPAAQLASVTGTVTLERDGGVGAARPGPLFVADVLTTGAASTALLRDSTGRQLELDEESRFVVGDKLDSMEVLAGDVTFLVEDGGRGWKGSVRTPLGVATLDGAGRLRVQDGGLSWSVTYGSVEFDVPDAGGKTVKAGESFDVKYSVEFEQPPTPPVAEKPAAVDLVVEFGALQLKRPGDKKFQSAKGAQALEPGSSFQVPPGSSARLDVGALKAQLSGGTSGVAEGLRTEGGLPVLKLTKVVGPVTLHFTQRAVAELGELKLEGAAGSTVNVTPAGKKQQRVDVRAGEVQVLVDGKPVTVRAGESLLVDGGKAQQVPGPKPAVVVPLQPRLRIHGDLKELGLTLPEESNRLVVAKDAAFQQALVQGTVGKQAVVPVPSKAPLFFKLVDAQGQATRQGRIDFPTDTASARDTQTRTDTVSETGQKATVFYQSKVPALTFAFTEQPGAKSWRFRLYRADATDQAPLVDRKSPEAKLVLEPGVLQEGEFLWSATGLDANGLEQAGARMNKLSVVYDNARTSLLIERPLPGERAGADTKASGVAPRASQLFVNGKLVKPDDAGRFSVTVGAVDVVVFRLVSGETESWWLRRLRR